MTAIKQEDLIQSVADAFQYISYYHPLDFIKALGEAYEREESPAAALSTSAHTALPASSKGIRPHVPAGCTAACALPVAANRNAGKRSLFLAIILLL